jgi:copper chaperone
MNVLYFKTTIRCNGCISNVTPYLNSIKEIKEWNVDLASPEKLLTVIGEGVNPEMIVTALKEAGYKADPV